MLGCLDYFSLRRIGALFAPLLFVGYCGLGIWLLVDCLIVLSVGVALVCC